jgi:hypothetical protein
MFVIRHPEDGMAVPRLFALAREHPNTELGGSGARLQPADDYPRIITAIAANSHTPRRGGTGPPGAPGTPPAPRWPASASNGSQPRPGTVLIERYIRPIEALRTNSSRDLGL